MRVPAVRMTIEELDRLPEDGNRYELIDGELYVTASPFKEHQRAVRRLLVRLDRHVSKNDLGEVFSAPFDVHLPLPGASGQTRVQPDLLFVSRERSHIITDWVRGAPDLVIEILSESTAHVDLFNKRDAYKTAGVHEYWIVNPAARTVMVYRFAESDTPITLSGGEALTSRLLPGFSLPVSYIFQ